MNAKKSLGQHFLKDEEVIEKIIESFKKYNTEKKVLEVGPGKGVLTQFLFTEFKNELTVCDLDERMVFILKDKFPQYKSHILHADVLQLDFKKLFNNEPFSIIGNFPYNISTEIVFKMIDNRHQIPFMLGMFQKEVAKRFCSKEGNKDYGITSIFLQAYYDVEYLFEVSEDSFTPPPKVKSAIIMAKLKSIPYEIKNEKFFKAIVKAGFNQRRKTLHNALGSVIDTSNLTTDIFKMRAEQLSVEEWINLSHNLLANRDNKNPE